MIAAGLNHILKHYRDGGRKVDVGRRKKATYIRKSFETRKPGSPAATGEKYVGITLTMIQSEAWQNLTGKAVKLYLAMRLQYNGENENGFYFNRALYQKHFKLYSNGTQFNKDLQRLIDNGFIDCKERNWTTRTKNLYAFSDRWQQIKRCKKDMTKQNEARLNALGHS